MMKTQSTYLAMTAALFMLGCTSQNQIETLQTQVSHLRKTLETQSNEDPKLEGKFAELESKIQVLQTLFDSTQKRLDEMEQSLKTLQAVRNPASSANIQAKPTPKRYRR